MKSTVEHIVYENGEVQNVEVVSDIDWNSLDFAPPPFSQKSVSEFARLYRVNMIGAEPENYGTLVIFHVPNDFELHPFDAQTEEGYFFEVQSLCAYHGNKLYKEGSVRVEEGKVVFSDSTITSFFSKLQNLGYLFIEQGNLSEIVFMPVSSHFGFLSDISTKKTVCNSHFFLMDFTDRDSMYDVFGTPYGFCVKDGNVTQAPVFNRDAFLVNKDASIEVKKVDIIDCSIIIDSKEYIHNKNAHFYSRPQNRLTPKSTGCDIVIINNRVVAIKEGGNTTIPSSGFVVHLSEKITVSNTLVTFGNFENYVFALQVGTTLIRDGKSENGFTFPFYDLQKKGIVYPPTKYPLDFNTARAARMGIGRRNGKGVIVWVEGIQKHYYRKGEDSCGASLLEFQKLGEKFNLDYLVNLDGGGSSQIIHNGKRNLRIADRKPITHEDAERPVPMGISFGH